MGDQTLDCEDPVGFMLQVERSENVNGLKPTMNHMTDAANWHADPGSGYALQRSQIELRLQVLSRGLSAMTLE